MFALFINLLPMLNVGCGDVLFFEKNAIIKYNGGKFSNKNSEMATSALDLLIELDKKRFGNIKYEGKLTNNHSLMLYAYKSSMNLHIYKVCSNDIINNFDITGPIITNHQAIIGYHMDVIDYRIAYKLYLDNFVIFGDTNILRNLSGEPFENDYYTSPQKDEKITNNITSIRIRMSYLDILLSIIFLYVIRQISII